MLPLEAGYIQTTAILAFSGSRIRRGNYGVNFSRDHATCKDSCGQTFCNKGIMCDFCHFRHPGWPLHGTVSVGNYGVTVLCKARRTKGFAPRRIPACSALEANEDWYVLPCPPCSVPTVDMPPTNLWPFPFLIC